MKRHTRLFLLLFLLGGVLSLVSLVVLAVVLYREHEPSLSASHPKTLLVKLGGSIPKTPESSGLLPEPSEAPPLLDELTEAIREAAQDDAIDGLLLLVDPVDLGWASVEELADAIRAFHDSGKPCHAQAEELGDAEYLLAAACGDVHLSPAGVALVDGISATVSYYAGTLEKLDVHAEFEHVGEYKSASEPLTRSGPSEPAREAMDALLDDLYGGYVERLARWRGMEPAQVRALLDHPALSPQAALESGLVDALDARQPYRAGFEHLLRVKKYVERLRRRWKDEPYVAVVHAVGTIVSGKDDQTLSGGRLLGDRSLARLLDRLRGDEDVAAVVLRVDSPGGSGLASENIWNAVRQLQEAKPVVVSMGDYAASGGYYISVPAGSIVAEPATLTGSIGVLGGKVNVRGLLEKLGVSLYTYKRGAEAGLLSSTEDFSPEGRRAFRRFLEDFYQLFLQRVSEGRGLPVDAVDAVARGRVWSGRQAAERGLVDELGGFHEALALAREQAGGEVPGVVHLPERKSLLQQLLEDLEGGEEARAARTRLALLGALPPAGAEAVSELLLLRRLLERGEPAALLPFRVDWE